MVGEYFSLLYVIKVIYKKLAENLLHKNYIKSGYLHVFIYVSAIDEGIEILKTMGISYLLFRKRISENED